MSNKMQKKLQFVPILNIVLLCRWMHACMRYPDAYRKFLPGWFKILGWCLVITVPRIVLTYTLRNDVFDTIATWIAGYFYLLAIAIVSVREQERINCQNCQREMPSNEGVR